VLTWGAPDRRQGFGAAALKRVIEALEQKMIPVAARHAWGCYTTCTRASNGVALRVQEVAEARSASRKMSFVFAATPAGLIKLIWHDGQGLCCCKRLSAGRFNK